MDEMIEAVPDEQLSAHYTGGGPQNLPNQNEAPSFTAARKKIYSCCGIAALAKNLLSVASVRLATFLQKGA
ncbi:hypothetical protein YSY43_43340 [Paenibacillus sp. YSY-4.3]